MKKIGSFLLIMMLSFSAVACGKGSNEVKDAAKEAAIEETVEENGAQEESSAADADQSSEKEEASGETAISETSAESATQSASDGSAETKDKASSETSESAALEKSGSEQTQNTPEGTPKDEASNESQSNAESAEAKKAAPAVQGYGRMVFVGDSRSVDMFSADVNEISGETYNGITVFCIDGGNYDDMVNYISGYGTDNFDTLVSWMGCNDFGNFSQYGPYYDQLLAQGKQIVVCTVGPTKDECLLDDMDWYYYPNSNQINYNNSLVSWANSKGVKVIDLYSYISGSSTISVVPTDGIHYLPQPTTELWSVITSSLK